MGSIPKCSYPYAVFLSLSHPLSEMDPCSVSENHPIANAFAVLHPNHAEAHRLSRSRCVPRRNFWVLLTQIIAVFFLRKSAELLMSSLLQSRAQHKRLRILSRKARETEVYDRDPPHTPRPVANATSTERLSNRQRSQRERRRREHDERLNDDVHSPCDLSNIFSRSSIPDNVLQQTGTRFRRKKAQQARRLRERTISARTVSHQDIQTHSVCTYAIVFVL